MSNGNGNDPPPFQRRTSDAVVSSLSLRVQGLENRMELVETGLRDNREELRENTKMTTRITHVLEGAGDGENTGMQGKVESMYDVFDTARSGFRMIGKTGDFLDRHGKKLFWIGVATVCGITYLKTGQFPKWLAGLLV